MNFKEEGWSGFKNIKKFKSLTKFLESVYKEGIFSKGKKRKSSEYFDKGI